MLDRHELAGRCQEMLKMPIPSSRIFALPELADGRPIQNCFDATTQAGGRFWHLIPYRPQRFDNQRRVDFRDRQPAKDRRHVLA